MLRHLILRIAPMHTKPIVHTKALQHAPHPSRAGRSFFDSLDRNGDGAVSLDDLRAAMRSRKLPEEYAHQFLARARRGRWWVQRVRCGSGSGLRGFCLGNVRACPYLLIWPDNIYTSEYVSMSLTQ